MTTIRVIILFLTMICRQSLRFFKKISTSVLQPSTAILKQLPGQLVSTGAYKLSIAKEEKVQEMYFHDYPYCIMRFKILIDIIPVLR